MANEFLPFALDSRANVMHPANWAEDRDRPRGFSAGPIRSAKINLLHRQSAFITATIARYIAETTGEDVLDNGDFDGFFAQFLRALGTRRQILMNDLDLYVGGPAGNDANTGTQERPFATLQAAANFACYKLDIGPHTVNIRVAEGTYDGVNLEGSITPDPSRLNFIGDTSDPSRVVIANTAGTGACFQAGAGASFTINGFTIQNTTSGGIGIMASQYGAVWAYNVHFGPCAKSFVEAWYGIVSITNDIRVVGGAPTFAICYGGQIQLSSGSVIFLGNPVIPTFVEAAQLGYVWFRPTAFAGLPAQGTVPVKVSENSVVNSSLPIPGSEPSVTDTGGLYIVVSG